MNIHTPSIPLAEAKHNRQTRALEVVSEMTEEQLRYAMWICLIIVFGSQYSNATELVAELRSRMSKDDPIWEAHLILAQVAISESCPEAVEELRQIVEG